jgi:acyl carrier protein
LEVRKMTQEKKLALLEDMMELEPGSLTPETVLEELEEWDSIALLSFMALMDEEFGKTMTGGSLREMKTVSDLLAVMEK